MTVKINYQSFLTVPIPKEIVAVLATLSILFFSITISAQEVVQKQFIKPVATAVVNFKQLAAMEQFKPRPPFVIKGYVPNEGEYEEPFSPFVSQSSNTPKILNRIAVSSPPPILTYEGAPDEAQGGGTVGTYNIPPDTYGAVGLDKVFTTLNNNYRVHVKATGASLSLVSMPSFWAPLGAPDATGPFDPRVVYDPYNNRWILAAVSNGSSGASRMLLAISSTHDPEGTYTLYSFDPDAVGATLWADFPMLGFNKNWLAVSLNMFTVAGGAFSTARMFVIDYPALLGGTATATLFDMGAGVFCVHPAETYSSTESTLYAPCHISSGGASYKLNTITGTPSVPVVTIGTTTVRPGGGWSIPSGNVAPQTCLSSCPAGPPFPGIDVGDAQVRGNAVFRGGAIWYTQAIGLPSGTFTRVSVQWTKLSTAGVVLDGGRIDNPTATASNGEQWYTFPTLAVNATDDVLVGFSKTESDAFAGASYAMRLGSDIAGTMQDPVIFKDGDDYYDKTASGRTRWGDYSHTVVDPVDDASFWTIQEYAKLRAAPSVFSTLAKWGTWWAKVAPNACLSAVASGSWSIAGTWGCGGVPTSTKHVSIVSGHNVTLDVDPSAASITVNSGGTLTISTARTLSCKLIVYGTIVFSGSGKLTLGTNDIFLSGGATLTGASSSNYFVTNSTGKLTKIISGGGSFEFPVSPNTTSYNALTIATAGGNPAEVFSVRVDASVTPSSPDNTKCVQRTWNINEMTSGGNSATLTFKWAAAEHGTSFSGSSAFAYRHNGSTYVIASSMTSPVLATGIYSSSTVTPITTFSPWIVAGTSVLPIVMDYITGIKLPDNTHKIDWKAICSSNSAYFELQRSGDGRNFTVLNSINADYTRCLQPFTHIDNSPLQGKNFYRVMVRDEVGKITYSNIVLLLNSKSGFEILNLQPNPVTNTAVLNFAVAVRQTLKLYVTDNKGSRVMVKDIETVAGSNQQELNFANLSSGTYLLTLVSDKNQKRTIAFVKQ